MVSSTAPISNRITTTNYQDKYVKDQNPLSNVSCYRKKHFHDKNFQSVVVCIKPLILVDGFDTLNQTLAILDSYRVTSFKGENLVKIKDIYENVVALKNDLISEEKFIKSRSDLIENCLNLMK